jgi:hypothetical protein
MDKRIKTENKTEMRFNVGQLERIIVALLTDDSYIVNNKFVNNVYELFNSFKENSYINKYDNEVRVALIKTICDKRINDKLTDRASLITYLQTDGYYGEDFKELLDKLYTHSLDENELEYINTMISTNLLYGFIGEAAPEIMSLISEYEREDYKDINEFLNRFEEKISDMSYNIKVRKASSEDSKYDVSLSGDSFDGVIGKLIEREKNPALRIRTGLKLMNDMLGGGFEPGRFYVTLGLAKG